MSKAGFELEITELRLGLPGGDHDQQEGENKNEKKRVFSEIGGGGGGGGGAATGERPKVAAVGWPPVCSYRRRSIGSEKDCVEASKRMVKISMDGVPFLRKIDVNDFHEYSHLVNAVEKLFGCSAIGAASEDVDESEYVLIYEDKDRDWLLVGDVPWQMFVESCKRLRIMKRADAKGFGLQSKMLRHG